MILEVVVYIQIKVKWDRTLKV